ncbi:hypothetical protein GMMP15_730042 [Candidatus Magnetomoraceae bacterium gMMP-15]
MKIKECGPQYEIEFLSNEPAKLKRLAVVGIFYNYNYIFREISKWHKKKLFYKSLADFFSGIDRGSPGTND